jgi:LruC domain-containing protein
MNTFNNFFVKSIVVSLASAMILTSCQKNEVAEVTTPKVEVNLPTTSHAHLTFANTSNVSFNVRALDHNNKSIPLDNIKVYVGELKPENLILHGGIDENGVFSATKMMPSAAVSLIGKVIIDPNFVGLSAMEVDINKSALAVDYTFRFEQGTISNGRGEGAEADCNYSTVNSAVYTGKNYSVPNSDANGKPFACDLFSQRSLNTDFMAEVNTTLQYNQDNVDKTALANDSKKFPALTMTENGEVWITFVGEVAGHKNALGYYIYDESEHATLTVNDIKQRAIAFPNTSLPHSGGNLPNGFTYKIPGVIAKGKKIGFFIIANGNSGNSVSDNGKKIYYSDSRFNHEANENLKQHVIMLANRATDGKPQGILLSFEDLPRDQNMGTLNKDFNDVIFYITANPAECIVPPTMADVKTEKANCQECNEPKIYQDVTCGVLLFEDLWPKKGDFDMNDLVVQYKFMKFKNRNNKIMKLQADFDTKALGAEYKNGFGFEMVGFNGGSIQKVTGSKLTTGTIAVDGKGLESGQNNPTVIVFDNAFSLVKGAVPVGGMINTKAADKSPKPRVEFDLASVTIEFNTLPTDRELGAVPFNPFLISNGRREREVHLAGYNPTSKAKAVWDANATMFNGTDVTAADPFRTTDGKMPFALHLPIAVGANFKYPTERTSIENAYPDFRNWANDNTNPAYVLWYNNAVSSLVFE